MRKQQRLRYVGQRYPATSVEKLAINCGVDQTTIRRDIRELKARGVIAASAFAIGAPNVDSAQVLRVLKHFPGEALVSPSPVHLPDNSGGSVHDKDLPACARPSQQTEEPVTGTVAGYQRHRLWGEPVCEQCRLAWNAARRDDYRARKRGKKVRPYRWRSGSADTPSPASPDSGVFAGTGTVDEPPTLVTPATTDGDLPLTLRSDACKARSGTFLGQQGATGTPAGYQRHRRANEVPCEPCAEARRAEVRGERSEPAGPPEPRWEGLLCARPSPKNQEPVTGKMAGYRRHINAKQPPCPACREANAEYQREYYQANIERERRNARVKQQHYSRTRQQDEQNTESQVDGEHSC